MARLEIGSPMQVIVSALAPAVDARNMAIAKLQWPFVGPLHVISLPPRTEALLL
jgi:hypothetical protein